MPKLPPLIVALLLTACGSEAPVQTPAETPPQSDVTPPAAAGGAKPDVQPTPAVDGTPITTESDLLKEVGYLLKGVQNLDQALAAREQLTKIGQRAQPLIDKHKQAFAASPTELAAFAQATKLKLSEGLPLLQAELDRIAKIPGAREALEVPMTKIMGILNPQL